MILKREKIIGFDSKSKHGNIILEPPGAERMQSRRLSVCSVGGEPDLRDGFRNWIKTQVLQVNIEYFYIE